MNRLREVARSRELWLLTLVALAAFAIRIYRLGSFPDTFLADEADNSQDALRIQHGQPRENGFFGFDWTPQPAMSVYVQSAFFRMFGASVAVARLPGAVLTTVVVVALYLLLRRTVSATAALLACVLLATDVWYLNFSRSAWNNAWVCLFALMAMLCLLWALDGVRAGRADAWSTWAAFVATGVFCALGIYGYPSGRSIALAIVLSLPVAVLGCRAQWRGTLVGYGGVLAVTAALVLPFGMYAAKHWDAYNGRTRVVSITNTPDYKTNPVGTLWGQMKRNVQGPWAGDVNNTPQYSPAGEPQLDRVTGLLVAAGMALTLVLRELRRRTDVWLCWILLLVAWGTTQLLTIGTPNGARGVIYVPLLAYFAGIAVQGLLDGARWLASRMSRARAVTLAAAVAISAAVAAAGVANVRHYVSWQRDPGTRQARWLYLEDGEFRDWAKKVVRRADAGEVSFTVGQWRNEHPLRRR